eukprot:5002559-Amphidinium_carterae.1
MFNSTCFSAFVTHVADHSVILETNIVPKSWAKCSSWDFDHIKSSQSVDVWRKIKQASLLNCFIRQQRLLDIGTNKLSYRYGTDYESN